MPRRVSLPIVGAVTGLVVAIANPAMASIFGTLFAGNPPAHLGVKDGRLAPCPDRPNCVSSEAGDDAHRIAPLAFTREPAAAMETLLGVIRLMPRTTVVTATSSYLHVEFASATFGFVDDAEFALDAPAHVIAVRSAARLGYGDFSVNRDRLETLRAAFAARHP